jgi:hypothetical protein
MNITPEILSIMDPDSNSLNSSNNSNKSYPINESIIITLIKNNLQLPTYNLTEYEKQCIQLIINESPTFFVEIDKFLDQIISSGQISIEIIPSFIKLLADSFNDLSKQKTILDPNNIFDLIKFIIDIIIDFIPQSNLELIIIQTVVDTSLSLLKTTIVSNANNSLEKESLIKNISSNDISTSTSTEIPFTNKNNCCWKF